MRHFRKIVPAALAMIVILSLRLDVIAADVSLTSFSMYARRRILSLLKTDVYIQLIVAGVMVASFVTIICLLYFFKKALNQNKSLHPTEEFKDIINTAPIAYVMVADGKVVMLNDYLRHKVGASVGADIAPFIKNYSQRGELISRINQNEAINGEILRIKMLTGEVHRFIANLLRIQYDGRPVVMVWGMDIEEIMVIRQNQQTLLDFLPVPVMIMDLNTQAIVYNNNSYAELFAFDPPGTAVGQTVVQTMPERQHDGTLSTAKLASIHERLLDKTEPLSIEIDCQTTAGQPLNLLLTAFTIYYSDHPSLVGVFKDLSREQRETELRQAAREAKAASQAKSRFLANMSHEIRTPMNSIIGFAEMAMTTTPSPATKAYIAHILESADLMVNLINDILDISKIEAGRIDLENIPFHMHEVINSCLTFIEPKAKEKGVTLYCYVEPTIGRVLLGDPTRLRQVLLNLLTNAVKFTHNGMVKLLSVIEKTTDDHITIRFEIKDSGIGITPEQLSRIFDVFSQADQSTTREYGGTGLGLPIAKNIIELMGGLLTAESVPDVGSKFSFSLTFPTVAIHYENTQEPAVVYNTKKPTFAGDILVCEDNNLNQQLIVDQLKRVGFNVTVSVNGQEGAEHIHRRLAANEKDFDLIFMDIHMPVMDGLETTQLIRKAGCRTPIVALTANIMMDDRIIYQQNGMQDFLGKPFNTQDLWDCLLRHLTPVDWVIENTSDDLSNDDKLYARMLIYFYADHKNDMVYLREALSQGDIERARRLAHTLKGVASQMGERALWEAARAVEQSMVNEIPSHIQSLTDTLTHVFNETMSRIAPRVNRQETQRLTETERKTDLELFYKLKEFLAVNDADSLETLEQLNKIPGMEQLSALIELYDFEQARHLLDEIIVTWELGDGIMC